MTEKAMLERPAAQTVGDESCQQSVGLHPSRHASPVAPQGSGEARRLADAINQGPRLSALRALSAALNNGGRAIAQRKLVDHLNNAAVQRSVAQPRPGIPVMQLRPADFFRMYSIPFRYDAKDDRDRYAGFKGQRDSHAAQPINRLREEGVITTDPDQDFIGGHLLKAQYGGQDEPDNVVPWTAQAEGRFSDYEAKYGKLIKEQREFAGRQGKIDSQGNWQWPFWVVVEFKDWPGIPDGDLRETLSAIPSKVTVNAGLREDFFHIEGKEISGEIRRAALGGMGEQEEKKGAESNASVEDDLVAVAKSKFQQNLKIWFSRMGDLGEETQHDAWRDKIAAVIQDIKDRLKPDLLAEIDQIIDGHRVLTPVEPRAHVRTTTSFSPRIHRFDRHEGQRREAIANPISLPSRTETAVVQRILDLRARYWQILLNNLIVLNEKLPGSKEENKAALRSVME